MNEGRGLTRNWIRWSDSTEHRFPAIISLLGGLLYNILSVRVSEVFANLVGKVMKGEKSSKKLYLEK